MLLKTKLAEKYVCLRPGFPLSQGLDVQLPPTLQTTKLYFFSQVRKQFKLLTVPFKPLCSCLQSDKLVNCHVGKFYKDLFYKLSPDLIRHQIVLFNDFYILSDFVEITSCVYTKTVILFNLGG